MRRKTLIVIALIAVMLLSSFLPLMEVYAAEDATAKEMTFNSDLYKGLKEYFQGKNIDAKYNDVEHTITMSNEVLNGIEEISLKEKGLSNIAGIENFTNVKSLILSANNLSEKSNLGVLNSLSNLSYLDLSSNNIKDLSEIESLIMRLLAIDTNAINISSQTAKAVYDIEIDQEEQTLKRSFTLPQILQMAGIVKNGQIENRGYLKADWFDETDYASSRNVYSSIKPYIVSSSIPNPVTSEDDSFDIQVGIEDSVGNYLPLEGLVKLSITIKDRSTEGYTLNPASKNLLKDSVFTIFFVVHVDDTDAVIIKDRNLYRAIKEQLTKNQEINSDLLSYKYGTTADGEIYYDVCDYNYNSSTKEGILSVGGTDIYKIRNFSVNGGESVIQVKNAAGIYVSTRESVKYEAVQTEEVDEHGVVTYKRKIKVPHINADCRDLYVDAWDEPQAFVITDLDLVNKITSLILNDKRIYDLSGLEGFIGLESNLNVSYNYIDTMATIYLLQKEKEERNSSLQELFNEKKAAMASKKDKVTSAYNSAKAAKKSIEAEIKKIEENLDKLAGITDTASSEYTNTVKAIETSIKAINGDGTDENPGFIGTIRKAFTDPQDGIEANLAEMYNRLAKMYKVYNKEYKLTTILTPEMNYQTEEEWEIYKETNKTLVGAKGMLKSEVSRINTLEKAGALTILEKTLIVQAFGLNLSDEQEFPVSYALNELVKNYEEAGAERSTWVSMNAKFIEIGIYSAAANYCLLERMNNDTAVAVCYVEDYLATVLQNYKYEDIDTTLVQAIYDKVKYNNDSLEYDSYLNTIFTTYIATELTYEGVNLPACKGRYYRVSKLDVKVVERNSGVAAIGNYPSAVDFTETISVVNKTSSSGTLFFDQLMSLANKFTAIDETSLYVNLPTLKRIDVRNNEIETLGPIEVTKVDRDGNEQTSTETLATLKNLKELYAGHNFVSGDIACVDWTTLTSLKKLDLSYNFIRDIKPLEVLKNLRYLDVSDNLLAGSFNISLRKMEKLRDVKLAGNQYSDINQILYDYEMISGGDFTNYFAREDTLNLDLSRQELEINIEDPIPYDVNANVKEIELPPIFEQLEYIDAPRTAFGTTSSKGSVQARGGVAYIPVHEAGDYVATVKVIAANGYPEDVTTSVGIDTICTINYAVRKANVTEVKINENITTVEKGQTYNFTATVEGENIADTRVTWLLSGNNSAETTISDNGELVVAADETSEKITIIATSRANDNMSTRLELTIVEAGTPIITGITIEADKTEVNPEGTVNLSATVQGTNLDADAQAVTWSIAGNNNEDTKIDENGVLVIGKEEIAGTITVTATSVANTAIIANKDITVVIPEPETPVEPEYGYTVSSDGTEVVGISPNTATTNFKSKFVNDPSYTVEVRRDGETISDTDYVATSDIVVISKDGQLVGSYELVVKGDVNGDGVADALDSSLIKAHRAKIEILSGTFLEAADINNDGYVDIIDVRLLLYHRARIEGYIL